MSKFNIVWSANSKDLEFWIIGNINHDGSITYRYDNTTNEDDDKITITFVSRFIDDIRCYIISYESPLEDVFDSCREDEDDPELTEKYENIFLTCLDDYFARNHLYTNHDLGVFISDYMRFRPQIPLFLINAIDRFIFMKKLPPFSTRFYRPGQAQPYFGYSCREEKG